MQIAVEQKEQLQKQKGDKQSQLEHLENTLHSKMEKHQKQLLDMKKKSDSL